MNIESVVYKFSNREEFRNWLTLNHFQENGIWIQFVKGNKDFSSAAALEEAICFGWIDGLMKAIDTITYMKYFSRRKNIENWSEKNIRLYNRLLQDAKITDAGKDAYRPNRAKKDLFVTIEEMIAILRSTLNDDIEILNLYNACAKSRQNQLAAFYCDAKTEETKKKRKDKIINALKNNYKGMLY